MKIALDNAQKHTFMTKCYEIAGYSTCASRQVGAVLITPDRRVVQACNDMPSEMGKCGDRKICRCFDPDKVSGQGFERIYAAHAEEACITMAARAGICTNGATMVTTTKPCKDCARMIAMSGITYLIYDKDYPHPIVDEIFAKAGVKVEQFSI